MNPYVDGAPGTYSVTIDTFAFYAKAACNKRVLPSERKNLFYHRVIHTLLVSHFRHRFGLVERFAKNVKKLRNIGAY